MCPELPTTLPPCSPPALYPDGLVEEIPRKRSEILGLEMERDVDYRLVRRDPRRRKKHYNCSPTVPLLLLLIGVIIFAIGYIGYSIILGTQEFELEVSENVLLLKSGHKKFLVIGEDTVTIRPDSMGYTDQEYVEYNFTLISQELDSLHGRKLNITKENYRIIFDDEIQEKTVSDDCSKVKNQLCNKVTKYIPFGGYELNKIVVYYSLKVNGQLVQFKRTFNVEIDEDKRTAVILEHVFKKVFKEQQEKAI